VNLQDFPPLLHFESSPTPKIIRYISGTSLHAAASTPSRTYLSGLVLLRRLLLHRNFVATAPPSLGRRSLVVRGERAHSRDQLGGVAQARLQRGILHGCHIDGVSGEKRPLSQQEQDELHTSAVIQRKIESLSLPLSLSLSLSLRQISQFSHISSFINMNLCSSTDVCVPLSTLPSLHPIAVHTRTGVRRAFVSACLCCGGEGSGVDFRGRRTQLNLQYLICLPKRALSFVIVLVRYYTLSLRFRHLFAYVTRVDVH